MVQGYIEIRGARENNLKDVSLRLPKRKISIFTGVSGSGKSSMVFDTIANEAQRLLFENFSLFIRNLLPRYPQPDADAIENLSMAVIVDQKRLGGGSQSTVGTVTDIASVLRLLFSRIGKPYVGYANAFSFNDPQGMCLECNGLGRKIGIPPEALIDKTKSLNEGAVIAPGLAGWESDLYVRSGFFDNDKKIADYTTEELDLLLYSEPRKHTGLAYNTYEGLVYKFNRKFVARDIQTLSSRIRQKVEPFLKLGPCPLCKGARLNQAALSCKVKGNTVIVVEHDPDVIKRADYIVDLGPYAGSEGGKIVYEGDFTGLLQADTLTGNHLLRKRPLKESFRQATGALPIVHATVNNLQDVSVNIPTCVLTVITGVAGSGKSSLINEAFLRQHQEAVVIDQEAIGTSSRSNPATYTGMMDDVRKAFAAANHADAGLFSFNSKGACPNCQGLGVTYTDLGFLEGVKLPCEVCGGKRFKDEVLAYTLNGKSIADVLNLTVHQALAFLQMKEVQSKLQALSDVGLDYLTLGQPLSTLSGGECQRIKLASELHKQGSIYVMDEPTTGLHLSDIGRLLTIMNRLVDGGNTVMVIEHHLDVIRNADWIIDMGPEGGNKGGMVIFEGTPRELLGAKHSLTSQYLG